MQGYLHKMENKRHLKNAPIIEALLDIRVKLAKSFKVEKFETLKSDLSDSYPITERQEFLRQHHLFMKGKPQFSPLEEGISGYFYKTKDKKEIAQFRRDGFTLNRLHPYTEWDDLIAKTKNLWSLYKKIANPEAVTRLAVRYINNLKLPLPFGDFSEYLCVPPNIPEGLPQAVNNFLNRITIYDSTQDIAANITQSLERGAQSPKNNHIIIILDIDVYRQGDFSMDNQEIWENFEKLRNMKNDIFFKYITEKTVRLFE
jgi:uncharacterized protein (TIGR04255 family)